MANLLYRASVTPAVPSLTSSKNAPLTNLEVDGNFKSIDNQLTTLDGGLTTVNGQITSINSSLSTKAPLASPTFTGDVVVNSVTAVKVPVGTTGERPTGTSGLFRYNSTTNAFEGYSSVGWGSIGGGATGAGGNAAFWENDQTITSNYSITTNKNAGTFGPVTIADGVTVTVPDNSVWTIV